MPVKRPKVPLDCLGHLRRSDKILRGLIDRVGPLGITAAAIAERRLLQPTPLATLARSVVYQQLNGRVADIILGRVLALYGSGVFPEAAAILATPDESLRAAGLSRSKLATIRALAEATLSGIVPLTTEAFDSLSDDEIVARLTAIRGIGRWTVEMLLIFHLGRPDVLPATDYGVRKGFALIYGREALPAPRELLDYGERWRPWRSAAAWYLWRALDLTRIPMLEGMK